MIHHLRPAGSFSDFTDIYISVREREGRLYSDEEARRLPEVSADHPLRAEWRVRAGSARRLAAYLGRTLPKGAILLEVGCGNGWLASNLSGIPGTTVFALDVNERELEQGARVFSDRRNLRFLYGDIFEDALPFDHADAILLAGSIQYFPDLPSLIRRLLVLLSESGTLHILDSPVYTEHEVRHARKRSSDYYRRIGVPEMIPFYHHHTVESITRFQPRFLYRPRRLLPSLQRSLLRLPRSPFPWILIAPRSGNI